MPKSLFLFDGHSIAHRAFHAIPPLSNSKGESLNAVYGFALILLNILKKYQPEYSIVAYDFKGPTFRHTQYAPYKAHRPETDASLKHQLDRIKDIVAAFNIPMIEKSGFEADDVIGTLSKMAEDQTPDVDVYIVTGDNDSLQLVDSRVHVIASRGSAGSDTIYDSAGVKAKYGFGPDFLVDYKALRGDSSDNIPGVRGIGEKTATELILAYGHLEQIYEAVETGNAALTKVRIQELLRTQKEQAYLSKHLATIVRNVPITLDLEAARTHDYDEQKALQTLKEMEFSSLIKLLPGHQPSVSVAPVVSPVSQPAPKAEVQAVIKSTLGTIATTGVQASLFDLPPTVGEGAGPPLMALPETKTPPISTSLSDVALTCIDSLAKLKALMARAEQAGEISLDTETTSLDPYSAQMVGMSFAVEAGAGYYLPLRHFDCSLIDLEQALAIVKPVLENPVIRKIGHHLKFDALILRVAGIELKGYYFDTLLAAYVLHPGLRNYGLKDLAFTELGVRMQEIDELIGKKGKDQRTFDLVPYLEATNYAAADAVMTYRLYNLFRDRLKDVSLRVAETHADTDMEKVFFGLEMPLIEVLVDMEFVGVKLDIRMLEKFSLRLQDDMKVLENQMINVAGYNFNVNSTQQLAKLLFQDLGIRKTKKIKTGYSTDADSLEKIRGEHVVIEYILQYRELAKLRSTYAEALPPLAQGPEQRVHTSYNQFITSTGRLSSTNPNLQNIPIRTELGNEIRKAFIARDGCQLLAADYSQMEFRILAHMSGDQKLIDAFNSGRDFHTATAANIFNVSLDQVTKKQRGIAKTVNFGVIYGQSKYGLSRQLAISSEEAEMFIQNFFSSFPDVSVFLEKIKIEARTKGYVSTLLGRIRQIPEIHSPSVPLQLAAQREAINMPIQGTAADIVKIAMIEIFAALRNQKFESKLILQVHDEVVLECPTDELATVAELVRQKMEQAFEMSVPLKVDVEVGRNWGEMGKMN